MHGGGRRYEPPGGCSGQTGARTIKILVTRGRRVDATGLTLEEGETLVLRPLGSS
jgi:hypothetical protein